MKRGKRMDKIYKPKEVSKILNVTVFTLQVWDRKGKLKAYRTPTGRRYYKEEQINKILGIEPITNKRKIIAYSRVSSKNQKDDLKNQANFIREFCNSNGIIIDEYIEDIGSGLNYNRINWNKLLDSVMKNEIETIYITYKDRFIRFGFDWFRNFCKKFGTKIVVLNNETSSPSKELVDDLISIIHVFSCRIYGLKKYKKEINEDVEIRKEN